jgi:GT2 family glycosyltransferase
VRIGAVVSTYNRSDYVRIFLRSLEQQTRRLDSVVLADDGSAPDEWAAIQALGEQSPLNVTAVQQEDRGFRLAAARNLGVRHCDCDYILMLDSDLVLGAEVVAVHEELSQPGRFLLGWRSMLNEADTRELLDGPPTNLDFNGLWSRADHGGETRLYLRYLRHALQRRLGCARAHKPQLTGCHGSFFRSDYEAVNGFDEQFEGWGYEDDDFTRRLYRLGLHSRHTVRRARAVHMWHATRAPTPEERAQNPNRAYFYRENVPMRCERGLVQSSQPLPNGHVLCG